MPVLSVIVKFPRRYPIILLLACGLLHGCTALLLGKAQVEKNWTRAPDGSFTYSDPDLALAFQQLPNQQFGWRFKNKARVSLTLSFDGLLLKRSGDANDYALWGEAFDPNQSPPPLVLKPGAYVELKYPVRYQSPFLPFQSKGDSSIWLSLRAQWGRETVTYKLKFPPL